MKTRQTDLLVSCGIISSLFYVAMNVFVPLQWPGYNPAAQVVSELSAIGAPTRPLWVALGTAYGVLVGAFGIGVWLRGHGDRSLRVAAAALIVSSVVGLYWPPMHMRGASQTWTDTLHLVWAVVTLLLMLVTIAFGAAAFGARFRHFSLGIAATFVVFGILTFRDAQDLAANLPTPWIGVWERINIGAYMLWVIVFAIALLRPHSYLLSRESSTDSQDFFMKFRAT
jgi:hypothetical protein